MDPIADAAAATAAPVPPRTTVPPADTPSVVPPRDRAAADPGLEAQEEQWFNEDDEGGDGGNARDEGEEPEQDEGDVAATRAVAPTTEVPAGDAPAAAAPSATPLTTEAPTGTPAATPPTPEAQKPAGPSAAPGQAPATQPEAKPVLPPGPVVLDFDAAMQKAVAEPLPAKIRVGDKDVDVGAYLNDFACVPCALKLLVSSSS